MGIRAYLEDLAEQSGWTRDLTEELTSHVQLHIEDNLRSGMSAPEARRQALIRLGGVRQVIEQCRDVSSQTHAAYIIRVLRLAVRAILVSMSR